MLSGHTEFEYARQALAYGVKDYIVKPAKYKEMVSVFSRLREEFDAKAESTPEAIELPDKTGQLVHEDHDYDEKIIETVKSYVEGHYKEVQLQEAAKLVHFNPKYLSQYFKLKTGQNFSSYVLRVRMQKAAELLNEIGNKIYDVSEEVGYSNPKNFTRTFKVYFGKSPSEFRHRNRGHHFEK